MTEREKNEPFCILVTALALLAAVPLRLWAILSVYRGNIQPVFGGPELRWQVVLAGLGFLALLRSPVGAADVAADAKKDWSDRAGSAFGHCVLVPLVFAGIGWWLR